MISTFLEYFRERFRLAVFGPVFLLLAAAGCWAGHALQPRTYAEAVGLIILVVTQFRLWDDLADRERDRTTHPGRVLLRAAGLPFMVFAGVLGIASLGAAWWLGGLRPFLALATQDAVFALLYGFVRRHLGEELWRFPILLAKYPAFVGLVAMSVGAPSGGRLATAALLVYVAAHVYELLQARRLAAFPHRPGAPTPAMFERVRCYSCASERSTFQIEAEDDLTGRPGRFTFVRCLDCGLVYQSPRLALEHIKGYYDDNYIAHQERGRWGPLAPAVAWAMGSIDRAKHRIVSHYLKLGPKSCVLDVGCGAGTFLAKVRDVAGATVVGVDFVDLSARPAMRSVEFHHGLFYEQTVGADRFDLITMWHFLEHDYDPARSLRHAATALKPDGLMIVEVPRLDSLSARLFGARWPGLQAPQHTAVYDRESLAEIVRRAGLETVEYLPYGAFPPYFYLFCGVAFCARQGRGLNLKRAVLPYFAGQLLCLPLLPFLRHMNFAMQTIVCRRART